MEIQPRFQNEQVLPDNLPDVLEVSYRPLAPNYMWAKLVTSVIRSSIVVFALFVVLITQRDSLPEMSWLTMASAALVYIGVGLFRSFKVFKKKSFAIRTHDILYKSGWIWKKMVVVPYNRIQHVELNSGPIDRAFELTVLSIFTAGGSRSDLSIPGLEQKEGEKIKAFLLSKMIHDEEE